MKAMTMPSLTIRRRRWSAPWWRVLLRRRPSWSRPPSRTFFSPVGYDAQDLSGLDYGQFRPLNWEAEPKTARVTMRLPAALMAAVKARAAERGIPHQPLIREAIERAVRG